MATWNAGAVIDAVIGFKKAVTLQMLRALRDNPIAIIEGAPGAPRIAGQQGPAVQTGGLTDLCVTEAKLAGSIGHLKLKTAVASASYSFGSGGGTLNVALDALSFFPSHNGANATVTIEGGGASPDLPAVKITASGAATGAIYWRYMLS